MTKPNINSQLSLEAILCFIDNLNNSGICNATIESKKEIDGQYQIVFYVKPKEISTIEESIQKFWDINLGTQKIIKNINPNKELSHDSIFIKKEMDIP